ncbi:mitochondrial carrier [Gonapodya prolifera JEL478]|uniref:Mitochondrial carrier n=1 Tax=Gonapodya prolifera (strain JEL478) TaxID=1344416 RepID=A0A139ALW6_GONPJ|nr:mitochondrial carrier [Gonapodya prolifera JEL478]|eukprot:KXS17678.1 mitochondrial carrier [Gonapodya prolifera JEL478]
MSQTQQPPSPSSDPPPAPPHTPIPRPRTSGGSITSGTSKTKLSQPEQFFLSALAPAVACIFTNPFDTAKIRLQLQGAHSERPSPSPNSTPGTSPRTPKLHYRNSFDVIYKTIKYEGITGLQRGLVPAIWKEASKNVFRIGMYDPLVRLMHDPRDGSPPVWKRILAGSLSGAMGAFSCNPFELIKTRLQSTSPTHAVGHQHHYTGVIQALRHIVSTEGVSGLYRGSVLNIGRSILGSGSNLAAYSVIKEWLTLDRGWGDTVEVDMIAGMGSALASVVVMNPVDVVRTRFYNQNYVNGVGTMYTSVWRAFATILSREGPSAFYKGLLTHFLRIGPHFCLTFVFLGSFRRALTEWHDKRSASVTPAPTSTVLGIVRS